MLKTPSLPDNGKEGVFANKKGAAPKRQPPYPNRLSSFIRFQPAPDLGDRRPDHFPHLGIRFIEELVIHLRDAVFFPALSKRAERLHPFLRIGGIGPVGQKIDGIFPAAQTDAVNRIQPHFRIFGFQMLRDRRDFLLRCQFFEFFSPCAHNATSFR